MNEQTHAEPVDTLCACLSHLSGYYGRSISENALIAGLAYDAQGLTPDLFVQAAQRIGLEAQIFDKKKPQDVLSKTLPCVLLRKEGGACVLLAQDAPNAKIWEAETRAERAVSAQELTKLWSGRVILLKPKPSFIDPALRIFVADTTNWFRALLQENRSVYRMVILASVLTNIFAIAAPVYIMNVYDRVIPHAALETGWALSLGVLAVFVFDFAIRNLRGIFIDFAGRRIDIQATRKLFDQVMDVKMAHRPSSSGAYANMLREFEHVRDFFTSATLVSLVDLPFAALFVFIIFMLSIPAGFAVVGLMLFSVIASFIIQQPLKKHVRRSLKSSETKHGLLVESIFGLETLRTLCADGALRARYAAHVRENADAAERARYYSALGVNVASFVQQISAVALVLVGLYQIKDGALTMGALIACVMLSSRALAPITQLANLMSRYHQTMLSLETLQKIMRAPTERLPNHTYVFRPDLAGRISFRNVSFTYPQTTRPVLNEVSFDIQAGEKVGIVGRIGSGKSTIARLILRLYEPDSGHILIDGTDYQQLDPADLRRRMAYMSQDITLFAGTIRDNIALGRPQASEAEIVEVAKAAGAYEFIAAHPLGFDAPVLERGDGLSGGQKQCLALARALLVRPEIFVCDEPTNAMDMQAEENFSRVVAQACAGKTIILITHRTQLLPLVDRLIVIDQGRVVMDGLRDQVMTALSAGKVKAG